MESYILRVYRRNNENSQGSDTMLGLIEDPLSGYRWNFRSIEQLWMIINARGDDDDDSIKKTLK